MFIENKVRVGLRDINNLKELKNTSILAYFEDVASMHSELAGYGVNDIEKNKKTWILLSWRIKIMKRPTFNNTLKIKTWSRLIDKFYAFRDFKIYDENDNLIGIATSKWLFIDIDNHKIVKVTDEVGNKYKPEDEAVFEEIDLPKLTEPKLFSNSIEYKITRNMIDVNNHLHNIYYMDIAKEVLPETLVNESNEFEIMYKKEIKLGDTVKALYSYENNYHYVVIKNKDESILHAIIRLK